MLVRQLVLRCILPILMVPTFQPGFWCCWARTRGVLPIHIATWQRTNCRADVFDPTRMSGRYSAVIYRNVFFWVYEPLNVSSSGGALFLFALQAAV
ncbi:hypothetical protein B0H14DRAFT_2803169 [Mycena olivaceomarginata]|nr:hypothetical protein B0H14DRAFT_2803169 [Mycena olivaceomarginata]